MDPYAYHMVVTGEIRMFDLNSYLSHVQTKQNNMRNNYKLSIKYDKNRNLRITCKEFKINPK